MQRNVTSSEPVHTRQEAHVQWTSCLAVRVNCFASDSRAIWNYAPEKEICVHKKLSTTTGIQPYHQVKPLLHGQQITSIPRSAKKHWEKCMRFFSKLSRFHCSCNHSWSIKAMKARFWYIKPTQHISPSVERWRGTLLCPCCEILLCWIRDTCSLLFAMTDLFHAGRCTQYMIVFFRQTFILCQIVLWSTNFIYSVLYYIKCQQKMRYLTSLDKKDVDVVKAFLPRSLSPILWR